MWDGTFKRAYTNNPAWIYYDICTSKRYALGDRLTSAMLDKWSLYRLRSIATRWWMMAKVVKSHALLVTSIYNPQKMLYHFK
jgi:hypothetical protein